MTFNCIIMRIVLKIVVVLSFFISDLFALNAFELKKDWTYEPIMIDVPNSPEGFIYRHALSCGPTLSDSTYAQQEIIPLFDVYAIKGKNTRCVGVVNSVEPPRVLFEIGRDSGSFTKYNLQKIEELFEQYGWDSSKNINYAFFSEHKTFLSHVAENTEEEIKRILPKTECIAYDFHSNSGLYKSNGELMHDILTQEANQAFIDKQARKAKYSRSTKYSDLRKLFDEKDPETIEFVSKYLTWAGKWDKQTKQRMQQINK